MGGLTMKAFVVMLVLAMALVIAPQSAHAGFIGNYDVSLWTVNLNGGCGFVNTAGAPNSVALTSNDCGGDDLATDFTITALATGTWSFDWVFTTNDECCEDAGYLVNGAFTILVSDVNNSGSSGPIALTAGDVIGFRANATDGCCGSSTFTVTNFTATDVAGVPEPSTVALVGASFGLLLLLRRRLPISR